MTNLNDLHIDIFLDGVEDFSEIFHNPIIKGYTTNPSLMKSIGVENYESYAKSLISETTKSVSLEIIADDPVELKRQARTISSWGDQIFVKVPVCYTNGSSTFREIEELHRENIKLNVTALFHPEQAMAIEPIVGYDTPIIISYFAGRVADTGRDPIHIGDELSWIFENKPNAQLLWASCREVLNIWHADSCNFDIITCPPQIIKKLDTVGRNLLEYSRETVVQFHNDAMSAGYEI